VHRPGCLLRHAARTRRFRLGHHAGQSSHIDAQTAGLTAAELPQLELKWAFAFPGAQRARSQPAIAYGAVYVGSQDGTVYALDEETGCVRWTFRASAEVRTAIVVESPEAARARNGTPVVYFGDLIARVYAVDAFTGALLWMQKVDDHPNATVTAAPALHDGTLYVPVSSLEVTSAADPAYECCTFRGSVLALNARTGTVLWKTYTIPKPPALVGKTRVGTRSFGPSGAPVWNTPAIDATRGMLYVGTGENYSSPADDSSDALLAFRLRDGEIAWHAQRTAGDAWNVACMLPDNPNCPIENGPDVDFGAAVIVFDRVQPARCCSPDRSPETSTALTRSNAVTSSGATRSVAAASRAASISAWQPMANGCTCRSPT
jgi:polyvinyl alcohol dehydrogenase (cytochrome)